MSTQPATHETWSPPTFQERVAALVGGTTFRQPVGGRGTGQDHMPAAHAVAAALAFVKRGDNDIGPDVAVAMALGSDHKRAAIIAALAKAMKLDRHPLCRRNLAAMGYIANVAFDIVVHGRHRGRVSSITQDDWDMLVPSACRVLEALADAALAEAEGCWRRK